MEINYYGQPEKPELENWQDLSHIKKVEKLLKEGYLADCKFVVGPNKDETETIHGHKIMFVLESPVFEKLFNGKFSEGKSMPEVRIEDFYPEDFKNFCLLIYYYKTQPYLLELFEKYSIEELIELYRICHKYMVTSILKECLNYFQTKLDTLQLAETILFFELAHVLNDGDLLTLVKKAISKTTVFFHKRLNKLPPEIFYNYILILKSSEQSKKPSEKQIFGGINDYILANDLIDKETKITLTDSKEEKVEDKENSCFINKFLNFVDFNKMTPKEFIEGPGESELLNWKFKYEILKQLTYSVAHSKSCNKFY